MADIFIISAPSGSGKSTLVKALRKTVPNLEFSISYTTRRPRGSEQNGREYYFVTREEFETMARHGEFLEHAEVHGNGYGTARRFLEIAAERGNDLLLDIDVQGAEQIKRKLPQAIGIFILPPSRGELERRLRQRSQDSDANIQRRLETAKREIENYWKYDYILVNDRLPKSEKELQAILLAERQKRRGKADANLSAQAEMCRLDRMRERLQPILESFQKTAAGGGK